MSWWPTGMHTGFSDDTLSDYFPIWFMVLHNPNPLDAWFSKTKFWTAELLKGLLLRWLVVKYWFYISADVHFIISKKIDTSPSCLACAGEKQLRNRQNALSVQWHFLSFLSNCGVQFSAEITVTWSCLSSIGSGGNIQIWNSLKTSARDVQSTRVLQICFLGYFMTHHDIQKVISYHNFYLFFPICKWKEFKFANAPSIY